MKDRFGREITEVVRINHDVIVENGKAYLLVYEDREEAENGLPNTYAIDLDEILREIPRAETIVELDKEKVNIMSVEVGRFPAKEVKEVIDTIKRNLREQKVDAMLFTTIDGQPQITLAGMLEHRLTSHEIVQAVREFVERKKKTENKEKLYKHVIAHYAKELDSIRKDMVAPMSLIRRIVAEAIEKEGLSHKITQKEFDSVANRIYEMKFGEKKCRRRRNIFAPKAIMINGIKYRRESNHQDTKC